MNTYRLRLLLVIELIDSKKLVQKMAVQDFNWRKNIEDFKKFDGIHFFFATKNVIHNRNSSMRTCEHEGKHLSHILYLLFFLLFIMTNILNMMWACRTSRTSHYWAPLFNTLSNDNENL